MLRIWRNLQVNLRVQAQPRMGDNLLLSEKLTKLVLADDLGFCFVMLYHSTCTFSRPGIEPGDVRLNSLPHLPFSHNTPPNSVKGRGSKLVPINGTQAYTITQIYTAYAATHGYTSREVMYCCNPRYKGTCNPPLPERSVSGAHISASAMVCVDAARNP